MARRDRFRCQGGQVAGERRAESQHFALLSEAHDQALPIARSSRLFRARAQLDVDAARLLAFDEQHYTARMHIGEADFVKHH